jgi:Neuraminidase (sialidase)
MKTINPARTYGVVGRRTGTLFAYHGWPSIARDENGVLYAVASGFRVSHVCPFGKTVLYISRDDGRTWTQPMVINDTYMDDRDAGIVYLGNGRLLVSWFTHPAEAYQKTYCELIQKLAGAAKPVAAGMLEAYDSLPEEEKVGGSYVRLSEDYGVTWGETVALPVTCPHGPTLRSNGELIYFGYCHYTDQLPPQAMATYVSTDLGRTWTQRSVMLQPSWLGENEFLTEIHTLELPDGKLLAAFRVEGRFSIATAVSEDGGYTWTEPVCTDVQGSPPHLLLHSSGALICSYGRRRAPFGERAMVSYDLGKTWVEDYVLDDRPNEGDLGYPATVELDDGSLLTVYYQRLNGNEKCSILSSRWRLQPHENNENE